MKKIKLAIISLLWLALTLLSASQPVLAGTDLTVSCLDNGPCQILPNDTKLFDETGIMPGDTFEQTMTIVNNDVNDTCNLSLDLVDQTPTLELSLAPKMWAAISDGATDYFGSEVGGTADNTSNYQDLYDLGSPISLGSLAPSSSRVYTWYAKFDPDTGNAYQGKRTIFDISVSISCDGGSSGSVAGTSTSSTSDGGSSNPPVCTANPPASAPSVSITNIGVNTVSLSWAPVSPVTHYALIFTRNSDGEKYGSTNIGNVTTYTITNLSGGAGYTFEVLGVNDCAPGPRGIASSGIIPGPFIGGRPLGPSGEVLGETTASPSPEPSAEPEVLGEILGETTCASWKFYVPWILLIMQFVLTIVSEYFFRKDRGFTKHLVAIGVFLLSIALFYWLRDCNCYGAGFNWLAWLCKWYWLVAIVLTALLKLFSYGFVEEVEEKDAEKENGKTGKQESDN